MFYPFQSRWRTCCWNSTNSLGGNDRRVKSTSSGSVLISEQSGTKISALLTSPDLSGCLHPICDISEEGASHSRRGANFSGTCCLTRLLLLFQQSSEGGCPLGCFFSQTKKNCVCVGFKEMLFPYAETLVL